jgi:hypothetical protein
VTILGGITRTIYSNSKGSVQFLKQNALLTCFWRFLRFNILFKPTGRFRICQFYRLSNYCPVSNIKKKKFDFGRLDFGRLDFGSC